MANTTTDLYLKKLRQKYKEKGATEQEANTMASQQQSQQEAQQTQNKELNGWQKFGAGVEEFVDGMAQTFLDLGEGLVDAHAIALGSIAEWTGNKELAKNTRQFVERDWTDELVNQGNAFGTGVDLWRYANFPSELVFGKEARDLSRKEDLLPDVVDSISSGIGSSLGMGALSSIPYAGWALTGMAAGGASAEQQLKENPDLDIGSAMGYGIINGSVEVASELLVGKVLGLLGKGINKAVGGSAVSETATRFGLGSSTGGNILTNLIKEFNEEGVEEVVSELVDPIARKLTVEKDKDWNDVVGENWGNAEYWINDVWTAYWQGGLSSVVMGGTGAAVNAVKVGGVRNYNAVLQVRQVAEINEQIKELEKNNVGGRYNAKIQALTAQKENVINNFQKNFEEFARDYLSQQNGEALDKKQQRKADIYESLQQQNERNLREELAVETAEKAGADIVSINDTDENGELKPSYASKTKNYINYNGKQISAQDWLQTVAHEIGHLNAKDYSWVETILQDVDAQDLQNKEKEYNETYKESYTISKIKDSDYYEQALEQGLDEVSAINKARQQMIREEIAMDRFASSFNSIAELQRVLSNEKLSLIERLKERFINTYKHVEKAQKPKNYDSIIKQMQQAIKEKQKVEESNKSKDERYKLNEVNENESRNNEIESNDSRRTSERNVNDSRGTEENLGLKSTNPITIVAKKLRSEGQNVSRDSVIFRKALINDFKEKFITDEYNNKKIISKTKIERFRKSGRTLSYDEARLEGLLKESYSRWDDNYASSFTTFISPQEFLMLTATAERQTEIFKEANALDIDILKNKPARYGDLIWLEMNFDTGQITGHEGRHRMAQLMSEGFTNIQIVIVPSFDTNSYDVYNANKINIPKNMIPQKFGIKSASNYIIPFNSEDFYALSKSNIDDIYEMGETKTTSDNDIRYRITKDYNDTTPIDERERKIINNFILKKNIPLLQSKVKINGNTEIYDRLELIKNELSSSELTKGKYAELSDELDRLLKELNNEQEQGTRVESRELQQGVKGNTESTKEKVSELPNRSNGESKVSQGIRETKQQVGREVSQAIERLSLSGTRGGERRTNVARLGRVLNTNELYVKQNVGNGTLKTVEIDKLPETLQNEYNELSKLKTKDGTPIKVYFYVDNIEETKNGISSNKGNYIAIRLDSSSPNTALHELSHQLKELGSEAYKQLSEEIQKYISNDSHKKEFAKGFRKIEKSYKQRLQVRYSANNFGKLYAELNEEQKQWVDGRVTEKLHEEYNNAVIQGKIILDDIELHKMLFENYLDSIKKEYGIDLKPYAENYFEENSKLSTKNDITRKEYNPLSKVYVTEKNITKTINLVNEYYDKFNTELDDLLKAYDEKVVNAQTLNEANTSKKIRKAEIVNMYNYYNDIDKILKPIQLHFEKEFADNKLMEKRTEVGKKLESVQKTIDKPLGESVKLSGIKEEIINQTKKEQDKIFKYIDKKISENKILDFTGTYEKLKNLKEEVSSLCQSNIRDGVYDEDLFDKVVNRIDGFALGYEDEINNALKDYNAKKTEYYLEDETQNKKNRRDFTYDKTQEKEVLNKIKQELNPIIQEWKNSDSLFTSKNKSTISRFNSDTSTRKPKGKSLKNLLSNVSEHINELIDIKTELNNKLNELVGNDLFRSNAYNDILGDVLTRLDLKLGSEYDTGADSWYGLRNQIQYVLGYYNNEKDIEKLSKEFDERIAQEKATDKKEVKQGLKALEKGILDEIDDSIEQFENSQDEVNDLIKENSNNQDLIDKIERLEALNDKLSKNIKQAKKMRKKAEIEGKERANVWKAKYLDNQAALKTLAKANEDLRQKYLHAKYEMAVEETEEFINLKGENESLSKEISNLKSQIEIEKNITEKTREELKQRKAEYKKKVSESKKLTKKIVDLRKKLVLEKVNGKTIIKVDKNLYEIMDVLVESLNKDIKLEDNGYFFNDSAMKKFGIAFANNDYASFANTLIEELEAKGLDNELLALEDGDYLYYEDNFVDLIEAAFTELNSYQITSNEFTNVGKLMVRLANAKTDYKLLQEAYRADMTIRQAQVRAKSFTKFFAENTKNNSSRLNGVDPKFRDNLVKFVKEVRELDNLDSISNGELRTKIIDFLKTLKTEYNGKIEVNGIALDSGIVNMLDTLENIQQQSKEYAEDLQATAEEFEEKPKNKEKISKYEAKLYKDFFSGMKKFTDEVMHNRYWEIGNLTIKGTDFTQTLVNQIYKYKSAIKQLKWNPISKMYISPRNIFRELSAYDNDAYVMQLFNELEKGTIRTMQAKMDLAKPLKEFFDKNKKFAKELEVDSKKYEHTIEYGDGESFTASTTLLLDFYEAIQNENNKQHILNDGVEFGNVDPIKISEEELNDIEQAIREEFDLDNKNSVYAQYIDLLNTMYDKARQLKVETDIRMRGFSNIQEGFYYPTSVSDFNLDIDLSQSAYNMGNTYGGADLVTTERSFNKDLKSTRGAVRITNSYQKMLNHINGMASYYGVDTAILNFSKMYRYRVEGGISSGNAIRQLYGTDYKKFDRYLGELFKDMRGTNNPMTGTDATINSIEKLLRSGVVTATLVNPKVIATQPASLLTAMKYISPKHILSSLKEGFVLTSKYPPLPTSGAIRYFDQSALQAETGGIDNKFQKTLGKGISAGDHFAINIEWAACCKQVGLLEYTKGTTEYNEALKKAEELFNRVVFDTQPNNNALGKAEIMRSDNEIVKLLTMYRSQAMQNFNIAYDAINQLRTIHKLIKAQNITGEKKRLMLAGPRKELARALASLILEGVLFTFIGQLFAHFVNNDWDDEDFWANATKDFGVAYFNDNVLGILPVLNKLQVEIEDNLSVSANNITMGWLENIVDSIKNLISKPNPKQFVQLFSYGTGIPLATNYKYTKAIVQYISPEFAYQFDALYNGVDTSTKSAINYALNDKQYSKAYELYKSYNSRSIDFETRTLQEMFNLYKKGYTDVSVKGIPDNISYNGETIKIDKKKFKDIYSKVAKKINPLIRSGAYNKLTDEKKSLVIKYLLNTYYNIAKKSFTGQDMSFIEKIFYADYNLSPNLLLQIYDIQNIASDEKETRKAKIEAYIRKSSNYQAEKYFLQMTSGYSLNDEYKNFVIGYLTNKGLGWKKAKEIVWS